MNKYGLKRVVLVDSYLSGVISHLKIDGHTNITGRNGYGKTRGVFKNLCQFLKLMHKHIRSDTWHNYLISIKR
jgi:ABC-type cobalamin/Fe3+-siderophores transport system ATPase subunit